MKRTLFALTALIALLVAPASAQSLQPWSPSIGWLMCPVTTTANTVCGTPTGFPVIFGGLWNNSTSAQPAGNCQIFNGATPVYVETTIAAGQVITFGGSWGVYFNLGLSVTCAVTPGGGGLYAYYHY